MLMHCVQKSDKNLEENLWDIIFRVMDHIIEPLMRD